MTTQKYLNSFINSQQIGPLVMPENITTNTKIKGYRKWFKKGQ